MTREEEWHEHPYFNGQHHRAEWVQTWTSDRTDETEAPEGTPISCAVCGRFRDD